jgi:SAM-dependent methyltransferase
MSSVHEKCSLTQSRSLRRQPPSAQITANRWLGFFYYRQFSDTFLESDKYELVEMTNVLEHLPDTIGTMEEVWRILADGGKALIRVPYWNSLHWAGDPTHVKRFSQYSMNFFDPSTKQGAERPYYSKARFRVAEIAYWLPLAPAREKYWIRVAHPFPKRILAFFARYLCNIIWVLEFELVALKSNA